MIDVKGVLGQARKPTSAHGLSSAAQPKLPAVQILGKERAPQVDDAASAIATQLEGGIDHGISGMSPYRSEACCSLFQSHYLDRRATLLTKKCRCVTTFFIIILILESLKRKAPCLTATAYQEI